MTDGGTMPGTRQLGGECALSTAVRFARAGAGAGVGSGTDGTVVDSDAAGTDAGNGTDPIVPSPRVAVASSVLSVVFSSPAPDRFAPDPVFFG